MEYSLISTILFVLIFSSYSFLKQRFMGFRGHRKLQEIFGHFVLANE